MNCSESLWSVRSAETLLFCVRVRLHSSSPSSWFESFYWFLSLQFDLLVDLNGELELDEEEELVSESRVLNKRLFPPHKRSAYGASWTSGFYPSENRSLFCASQTIMVCLWSVLQKQIFFFPSKPQNLDDKRAEIRSILLGLKPQKKRKKLRFRNFRFARFFSLFSSIFPVCFCARFNSWQSSILLCSCSLGDDDLGGSSRRRRKAEQKAWTSLISITFHLAWGERARARWWSSFAFACVLIQINLNMKIEIISLLRTKPYNKSLQRIGCSWLGARWNIVHLLLRLLLDQPFRWWTDWENKNNVKTPFYLAAQQVVVVVLVWRIRSHANRAQSSWTSSGESWNLDHLENKQTNLKTSKRNSKSTNSMNSKTEWTDFKTSKRDSKSTNLKDSKFEWTDSKSTSL